MLRCVSSDTDATDVRITYDTSMTVQHILGLILTGVEHMAARYGRFQRLAIASAPVMDQTGQIIAWPNRPDWQGVNIARLLAPLVLDTILWCDDGVAGTLADAAQAPDENLLHLVLGSGVGGSLWLDGHMVFNPEFGHVEVVPSGHLCVCGKHGCLQAYVGGRALDAAMQSAPEFHQNAWVRTAADTLAKFLAQMTAQHDLDRISFSGGLLKRVPTLLETCQRRLADGDYTGAPSVPLTVSPYSSNAPLAGAAVLASVEDPENTTNRYGARMLRVRDI